MIKSRKISKFSIVSLLTSQDVKEPAALVKSVTIWHVIQREYHSCLFASSDLFLWIHFFNVSNDTVKKLEKWKIENFFFISHWHNITKEMWKIIKFLIKEWIICRRSHSSVNYDECEAREKAITKRDILIFIFFHNKKFILMKINEKFLVCVSKEGKRINRNWLIAFTAHE